MNADAGEMLLRPLRERTGFDQSDANAVHRSAWARGALRGPAHPTVTAAIHR